MVTISKKTKVILLSIYFLGLCLTLIAAIDPMIYLKAFYSLGVDLSIEQIFMDYYNKTLYIAGASPFFVILLPYLIYKSFCRKLSEDSTKKKSLKKAINIYSGIIVMFLIFAFLYSGDLQEIFIFFKLPDFLSYHFLIIMESFRMLVGAIAIIFFIWSAVNKTINYYRKRINQPIAETLLQKDTRNPILLLRPFKIDKSKMPPAKLEGVGNFIEIENLLAYILSSFGPVVAIGRPNEKLQPLGASRLYVGSSGNWQEEVKKLLDESSIILLFLDYSPGVKWEIRQTVEKYRNKVIFIPSLYAFKVNWFIFIFEKIPNLGLLCSDNIKRKIFRHRKKYLHYRRGFRWYQKWNQIKGEIGILPDLNDKVGCFVFDDKDKAILFESEDTTLTAQVNSMLKAINYISEKLDINRD